MSLNPDLVFEGDLCDRCWTGSVWYVANHQMACDKCGAVTPCCDKGVPAATR